MRTYRVSLSNGRTFTVRASSDDEARDIARQNLRIHKWERERLGGIGEGHPSRYHLRHASIESVKPQ